MRILSGLIRLIAGLAIMALALHVYLSNQTLLEGNDPVTVVILGQEVSATPTRIIAGLVITAMIGGLIELFGILTLVAKPVPKPDSTPPA